MVEVVVNYHFLCDVCWIGARILYCITATEYNRILFQYVTNCSASVNSYANAMCLWNVYQYTDNAHDML